MIGRRWVGGSIGALGLGAIALLIFAPAGGSTPVGTRIASVAVAVLSGFAAGVAGGAVAEQFERRYGRRVDTGEPGGSTA